MKKTWFVKLSETEKRGKAIEQAAARKGLSVQDWIRGVLAAAAARNKLLLGKLPKSRR